MTASEIENDHFDLDHFDRHCVHERRYSIDNGVICSGIGYF